MSYGPSKFDVFLSYSRKDNTAGAGDAIGWITALREEILADHRRFSTEPLTIFFDQTDVHDMDDWRGRIRGALRSSRILLVCLSPNYFSSEYCKWEFEEYVRHQVHELVGHDSYAQVYIAEVPDLSSTPVDDRSFSWKRLLAGGNYTDMRRWYPLGLSSLQHLDVKRALASLGSSLWIRIQRTRRATTAPGNLRRLNPRFVGRAHEIRALRDSVANGGIGVITAINGLGGQGKTELAAAYAHSWASDYPAGLWVVSAEGRSELLPTLGELHGELAIPVDDGFDDTPDLRGRRVVSKLRQMVSQAAAFEPDQRPACLIILDNVSDPALLSEPQVSQLPREDWLHILATTREGQERFHASARKTLSFMSIDGLADDDAVRLLAGHQPDGEWPNATRAADEAAARQIVRELDGFTLAIECIAVYLGLHPDIRPRDFFLRLQAEGLQSVSALGADADVAVQVQHREKQLRVTLEQTLQLLGPLEKLTLRYAALLPPDGIVLAWLRELAGRGMPENAARKDGYPDPWESALRRLHGLRLLTPGDRDGIVRMHRLIAACVRDEADPPALDAIRQALAGFLGEVGTPFDYGVPLEFFLTAWSAVSKTRPLNRLLTSRIEEATISAEDAERWTDLSFQLGDLWLEGWWLDRWKASQSPSGKLVSRLAAFAHRTGQTRDACAMLQVHLDRHGFDFELSSELMMYLTHVGRLDAAWALCSALEKGHADALQANGSLRARFLRYKYFLYHDLDRNEDAAEVNRFIATVYAGPEHKYAALITGVNLADALWAIGRFDNAEKLLRDALSSGRAAGFVQVEDIAAICLANVLSSRGRSDEADELYASWAGAADRVGHKWDWLYGKAYKLLADFEAGRIGVADFDTVRRAAIADGFDYLAALVDAHVCIASFIRTDDFRRIDAAIRRGGRSKFPACRLYALSAAIRRDMAAARTPDPAVVDEWLTVLQAVQGVKGRIGVILHTARWLSELGVLDDDRTAIVNDWTRRYAPPGQLKYHEVRYPWPDPVKMVSVESPVDSVAEYESEVRLRVCRLEDCEARCCYDGVYLEFGEEDKLAQIVGSAPAFFASLPDAFVVDGNWGGGRVTGRKTATRPHRYAASDFPAHFTQTRCVFCLDDHRCSLQVLAEKNGLHPWAYKPRSCWMFPLEVIDGEPIPPPAADEPDPMSLGEDYPGYAKFVPCGQDRADGVPWRDALAREIAYWEQVERDAEPR